MSRRKKQHDIENRLPKLTPNISSENVPSAKQSIYIIDDIIVKTSANDVKQKDYPNKESVNDST